MGKCVILRPLLTFAIIGYKVPRVAVARTGAKVAIFSLKSDEQGRLLFLNRHPISRNEVDGVYEQTNQFKSLVLDQAIQSCHRADEPP